MTIDAAAFIKTNTALTTAALVPEIQLWLASEITPIWQATEQWLADNGTAPPFWAFAWPGSIAMARHILDNPGVASGRRVLDFAAGCGLAAIACAKAGAATVEAAEIDPLAIAAAKLNASTNEVEDFCAIGDVVDSPCRWDLILCGDVCYEAPMTGRIMPWLRRMVETAEVWIADPGRTYLPATGLTPFAVYTVPTSLELEDRRERHVTLYRVEARGER
jgi:predicted nicotinamide N-methyase